MGKILISALKSLSFLHAFNVKKGGGREEYTANFKGKVGIEKL